MDKPKRVRKPRAKKSSEETPLPSADPVDIAPLLVRKPLLTKYEFNSLISLRTMHLSNMAIPLVQLPEGFKVEKNMDLRKIALQEMQEGKLPYMVKRTLPNKKVEYIKLKDMDLTAVRILMRE
jgi:DNA-directed RNA polymerase subunit K/omega